jgi:hypothetical protein
MIGINRPLKTTAAIVAAIFFVVFPVNAKIDQQLDTSGNFTIIAGVILDGFDRVIFNYQDIDAIQKIEMTFNVLDPPAIFTSTDNAGTTTLSEMDYFPVYGDIDYFSVVRSNGIYFYYVNNKLIDTNEETSFLDKILDLTNYEDTTKSIEVFNYAMTRQEITNYIFPCQVSSATTTPYYFIDNDDIGSLSGTIQTRNDQGTTTQHIVFKIPFLLYFYIFSIVMTIIIIIIAWLYARDNR